MTMNRSALALCIQPVRHPFRVGLAGLAAARVAVARKADNRRFLLEASDWKAFATAYCAAFVAASIFIA